MAEILLWVKMGLIIVGLVKLPINRQSPWVFGGYSFEKTRMGTLNRMREIANISLNLGKPITFINHICDLEKCQFQVWEGLLYKKWGLKFLSIPAEDFLETYPPPTPQDFLIPPVSLLDDLEFHVVSPPFLA